MIKNIDTLKGKEHFPDGSKIDDWFYDFSIENSGKNYKLTDYDIKDDGKVHTEKIQALIDYISKT